MSLRPTEVEGLYNFILTGKDIDHDTLTASPELLQGVMLKETGASEAELRIGEITWLSVYRYVEHTCSIGHASFMRPQKAQYQDGRQAWGRKSISGWRFLTFLYLFTFE